MLLRSPLHPPPAVSLCLFLPQLSPHLGQALPEEILTPLTASLICVFFRESYAPDMIERACLDELSVQRAEKSLPQIWMLTELEQAAVDDHLLAQLIPFRVVEVLDLTPQSFRLAGRWSLENSLGGYRVVECQGFVVHHVATERQPWMRMGMKETDCSEVL